MPTTKVKSETKTSEKNTSKATSSKTTSRSTAGKKAGTSSSSKSSGSSKSLSTTNHDEIKSWVEKRGGTPSTVKGTEGKDGAGLLRIDFPGYSGKDTLEPISWEEFFAKFDESDLQFLYQEKTAKGSESRFNKFVAK